MVTETKRKSGQNFRLSDAGENLLIDLGEKLGLKKTGVIELALRRLASAEGLPVAGSRASAGIAQNVPTAGESSDVSGTGV